MLPLEMATRRGASTGSGTAMPLVQWGHISAQSGWPGTSRCAANVTEKDIVGRAVTCNSIDHVYETRSVRCKTDDETERV